MATNLGLGQWPFRCYKVIQLVNNILNADQMFEPLEKLLRVGGLDPVKHV